MVAIIPFVSQKRYLPSVDIKKLDDGRSETLESFGIDAVVGGKAGQLSKIIPLGSIVPISRTKRYFPVKDYQEVIKVSCYKGEQIVANHNVLLGQFVVSGLRPRTRQASQGVDITFTIDSIGTILVDAVEIENPDNHLKVKLEYHRPEGLLKSVVKGVLKEVKGIFLPSGK